MSPPDDRNIRLIADLANKERYSGTCGFSLFVCGIVVLFVVMGIAVFGDAS